MISVTSAALSAVGKVREHNEDAYHADDASGLWVIADGMGGHACGEVASQLAVSVIAEAVAAGVTLEGAISQAHQRILSQGEENAEQSGMGTTAVAVQRVKSGFSVAWSGDSRAYIYDGQLQQITMDHTFVQDMVYREVLTLEEADGHPKRNLLNCSLGMQNGRFRVGVERILPNQSGYIMLCSDGVSDYVLREKLQQIFAGAQSLEQLSGNIKEAVMASEAADNFTFILLQYSVSRFMGFINRLRVAR